VASLPLTLRVTLASPNLDVRACLCIFFVPLHGLCRGGGRVFLEQMSLELLRARFVQLVAMYEHKFEVFSFLIEANF
jgi:hypothetical protein